MLKMPLNPNHPSIHPLYPCCEVVPYWSLSFVLTLFMYNLDIFCALALNLAPSQFWCRLSSVSGVCTITFMQHSRTKHKFIVKQSW